jgi:hypothetical protein
MGFKAMDTKEFIKKLNVIFKDQNYDFSKVKYHNKITKVEISCNKEGHGAFFRVPNVILKEGKGCPICKFGYKVRLTTEKFIELSKKLHVDEKGDPIYGYENTVFTKTNKKLTITCPVHGDFEQYPYNHWDGFGCTKCRIKTSNNKARLDGIHKKEEYVYNIKTEKE